MVLPLFGAIVILKKYFYFESNVEPQFLLQQSRPPRERQTGESFLPGSSGVIRKQAREVVPAQGASHGFIVDREVETGKDAYLGSW